MQHTPRVHLGTPSPRVQETPNPRVQVISPSPRVQESTSPLRIHSTHQTITAATVDKPLQQMASKTTMRIPPPTQTRMRGKISDARILRSRSSTRTHMQLRPRGQHQGQGEGIQLVRDDETGEYLNYRQLLRHPKHNAI